MPTIDTYPALVDAVWNVVKGGQDERDPGSMYTTEPQIAEALGLTWAWDDDACVYGVAQALSDLVDLGYCVGRANYNGARWSMVSPSPNAPEEAPSAHILAQGTAKLPPLRAHCLQYVHERTVRHESATTFYDGNVQILFDNAVHALLPDAADAHLATGHMVEAIKDLKKRQFVSGTITFGAIHLRPTLKGACWLLIGAPLLALIDRAAKLAGHPEASEAARIVMEAYSRSEIDAARDLTVAIEKLENATGGERKLADFLGQPKTYISDLKQSAQQHRHATTTGRQVLDHQERLARAFEIVQLYIERHQRP